MFNGFPPSPSATLFHMFQARYTKSSTILLFTMGGRRLNEQWAMQYYYRHGEILHTKLIVNIPATFLKVTTELGRTGIQTLQPNPEQFTIGAVIKWKVDNAVLLQAWADGDFIKNLIVYIEAMFLKVTTELRPTGIPTEQPNPEHPSYFFFSFLTAGIVKSNRPAA